jgi:hypothetical protein
MTVFCIYFMYFHNHLKWKENYEKDTLMEYGLDGLRSLGSILTKIFTYFTERTFEFSGKDCHSFRLCMKGL